MRTWLLLFSKVSSELIKSGLMKTIQIMGIVNVTPDSFFDGGEFYAREKSGGAWSEAG